MKGKNGKDNKGELIEFDENPYNPENSKPEQVARVFFMNDVSIIPVISRRGILLGILKKEDVIAELSDIERVKNQKIEQFIKKLSRKMSLDELLPHVGNAKEFIVVNLFGEIHGKWPRLKLFSACEQGKNDEYIKEEIEKQKEDQILEWMIYLILEHIPRALYALNSKNKTLFYNNYFEEIYKIRMKRDMDIKFVEDSLSDSNKNELFSRNKDNRDIYFYNKDMEFYYEKVPLKSKNKTVGFLIYCDNYDKELNQGANVIFPGINREGMSLKEMLESMERQLLVDAIKENNYDLSKVAGALKISSQFIKNRIAKYGIGSNNKKALARETKK